MTAKLIRRSPSTFEVKGRGPIRYSFLVTPKTKFFDLCDAVAVAGLTWAELGQILAVLSAPDQDRVKVAAEVNLQFEDAQ
jgi:hypothetical protein